MSRTHASPVMSNSTDALFRAWSQALHDMLIACGLVQTADTGQVNLATMTAPVALTTFAGYEVFRFNDTLQATKPIFLKVEYGSGNPLASPSVRITVGPGTNGAGTLTATWGAAISSSGVTSSLLPQACFASGDPSGVVVSMFSGQATSTTGPFQFFIERSRDSAGSPTGDGLAYGLGGNCRILAYGGTWSTTNTAQQLLLAPWPTPEAVSSVVAKGITPDGDTLYWMPVVFGCPGVPAWRSKMMVAVHTLDAAMGTIFTAAVYGSPSIDGAPFTFIQPGNAMPASSGMGAYGSASSTNYFLAQLWMNPPP